MTSNTEHVTMTGRCAVCAAPVKINYERTKVGDRYLFKTTGPTVHPECVVLFVNLQRERSANPVYERKAVFPERGVGVHASGLHEKRSEQ